MKAKKIVTQGTVKTQAPDIARPKRPTARPVYQSQNRAASEIETLARLNGSNTQIKAAVSALLQLADAAKQALLNLTGAPGIISQGELERVITAREIWSHNRTHGLPVEFPAAWSPFMDKLAQLVKDGWLVEPGQFFARYDRTGVLVFGDRQEERPPRAPRQADPQAPSIETLQSWFDLPSKMP